VRFANITPQDGVSVRANVYLDGVFVGAGLLLEHERHPFHLTGHTKAEGIERPYMFSKLSLTDDEETAEQNYERISQLGTIRIQIEFVSMAMEEAFRAPAQIPSFDATIHESHKKAGSHCTSLGNAIVSVKPKKWYTTTRLAYLPILEFVFSYASRGWLEAKGVIPDTLQTPDTSRSAKRKRKAPRDSASSVVMSDNSDEDVLHPDEALVYRGLKEKMSSHKKSKIKLEPGRPPQRFSKAEVIDLTLDD